MAILYSCIARNSDILCNCQTGVGNFEVTARQMISKISDQDGKYSYDSKEYTFHIVVNHGLIFLCAANKEFGKAKPHAFLQQIMDQFVNSTLFSRSRHAMENELNRDFGQVLHNQMESYSIPDKNDKINVMKNQVEEVKTIMSQNLESVLERGENLRNLEDKTEELSEQAKTFQVTSRKVKRKTWWANMKMKIVLVFGVLAACIALILIILFSTGVLPVKSN